MSLMIIILPAKTLKAKALKAIQKTWLLLGLVVLFTPQLVLAKVYVYERPDGSKLITDKRSTKKSFKLKRSYSTQPYRSRSSSTRTNAPYFAATIKSQYDPLIVNTALKYDLEPSFIKAIIHVESAFDRFAISHAGAMGLMQIMPATAADYQLEQDHFNANRNVEAGVQHLRELMDRYAGDKKLSLAAYNAGVGAVNRYDGVPPYEETENYIVKVMKLYSLYKDEF